MPSIEKSRCIEIGAPRDLDDKPSIRPDLLEGQKVKAVVGEKAGRNLKRPVCGRAGRQLSINAIDRTREVAWRSRRDFPDVVLGVDVTRERFAVNPVGCDVGSIL